MKSLGNRVSMMMVELDAEPQNPVAKAAGRFERNPSHQILQ
jgi:hypothetical protein